MAIGTIYELGFCSKARREIGESGCSGENVGWKSHLRKRHNYQSAIKLLTKLFMKSHVSSI